MNIKKILIVDDMPVARRILKSCIPRAEDYEFHEAEDGVKGLEVYRNIRPDLTFMDINMPNMDGMVCLEQIIKANPRAVVVSNRLSKPIRGLWWSCALPKSIRNPSKRQRLWGRFPLL